MSHLVLYLNIAHRRHIMKQLQQLLRHFILKFHYLKGFSFINASKKLHSKLQNFFEAIHEFQKSIEDRVSATGYRQWKSIWSYTWLDIFGSNLVSNSRLNLVSSPKQPIQVTTQLAFTFLKLTVETLEQVVKYVQS